MREAALLRIVKRIGRSRISLPAREGVDHGVARNRRAMLTGGMALVARVIQVGTSFITIPLTLKYLGNERFGLWMTISSVLALAAFADLGIGNGVLNTVAKAFGNDNMHDVRRAVSSGYAVLNIIAFSLIVSFAAIYPLVNWANLFRVVSSQARAEAGPTLAVFALCFALNISLDVVQRVQLGLQQGYRYGLWQCFGSLIGLIGVLCGIRLKVSLPLLVLAIAGAPLIATILNTAHFFGFVRPDLRPSALLVSREMIVSIAKLGGLFFILQLGGAISFSSDNLVLTRILGPLAVAQYAVPSKLFSVVAVATSFFIAPLWPAYAEAFARNDHAWIRRTLSRSLMLMTIVSVSLSGLLMTFGNRIIQLWVGPTVHASPLLLAGLGTWSVLLTISSTVAIFLNGLSVVRLQVVIAFCGAFTNIALSIYLTRRIGIPGVVFGSIIAQIIVALLPYYLYVNRFFKMPCSPGLAPD